MFPPDPRLTAGKVNVALKRARSSTREISQPWGEGWGEIAYQLLPLKKEKEQSISLFFGRIAEKEIVLFYLLVIFYLVLTPFSSLIFCFLPCITQTLLAGVSQ